MGARILIRATSVIGFALTAWANNVRWGTASSLRNGPPVQWERFAVAAALLSGLAAIAVWLGTRAGAGPSRRWLRGAGCVFAVGVGALAFHLWRWAARLEMPDMVAGPGWSWLAGGAGVSLAAAIGSLALRPSPAEKRHAAPPRSRRKRRTSRG